MAGVKRAPCLTVLAALALGPAQITAQGRLISADAYSDLTVGDAPSVAIEYTIVPDESGGTVPVEGLAFGGARITDVHAFAMGRELDVSLRVVGDRRVVGEVAIPLKRAAGQPFTFQLVYRVEGAEERHGRLTLYRLPILAVAWPSEEALPETFTVVAEVSDALTVYESFPSGLREVGTAGGAPRYRLSLPVIPALVSLRTSRGPPPAATLPRVLDLFVLVFLAGFGVLGWRRLRAMS